MQKTLLALAVMAASGAAMAQSSVTLFGTVDAAVTILDGEERVSGLVDSGQGSSALGFRGIEDLGGGAKAEFWLEGAVSNDDGMGDGAGASGPGFEFKRRSSLSLHASWGEIRMGRYLTAVYQATSRYDPFGANGIGASRTWAQGGGAGYQGYQVRQSNMVGYYSPNWSGFRFAINSAFGEAANGGDSNSYLGGSLTYDNGPLSIGLGLEKHKDPAIRMGDRDVYTIGASYQFGGLKVAAAYVNQESDGRAYLVTPTPPGAPYVAMGMSRDYDNLLFALTAKVGAVGALKFSYNRYEEDLSSAKGDHYALGYVHDISKRTAVYGTYAYMKTKNDALGVINGLNSGNLSAVADRGGKVHGLQLGIRHSF